MKAKYTLVPSRLQSPRQNPNNETTQNPQSRLFAIQQRFKIVEKFRKGMSCDIISSAKFGFSP